VRLVAVFAVVFFTRAASGQRLFGILLVAAGVIVLGWKR
jgi:multidrug transporter EmrE-like cation transporter